MEVQSGRNSKMHTECLPVEYKVAASRTLAEYTLVADPSTTFWAWATTRSAWLHRERMPIQTEVGSALWVKPTRHPFPPGGLLPCVLCFSFLSFLSQLSGPFNPFPFYFLLQKTRTTL